MHSSFGVPTRGKSDENWCGEYIYFVYKKKAASHFWGLSAGHIPLLCAFIYIYIVCWCPRGYTAYIKVSFGSLGAGLLLKHFQLNDTHTLADRANWRPVQMCWWCCCLMCTYQLPTDLYRIAQLCAYIRMYIHSLLCKKEFKCACGSKNYGSLFRWRVLRAIKFLRQKVLDYMMEFWQLMRYIYVLG